MTHAHTLDSITGYRLIITSGILPRAFAYYGPAEYGDACYDHQAEWASGSTAVIETRYSCGCWSNARFVGETGIGGETIPHPVIDWSVVEMPPVTEAWSPGL